MDKNIERLKKYLGKADDKLKEAGIEYKPERGDFSSDRSKVAGIVAEAYSNAVENCFRGNDCDEVLGGYDILDELMSGKSADELKDEICSHVVSDFLVGGKGLNEDLEESYFGPAQHPQLRFHTRFEVEADPDYPKESDFLDEDGDIDYVAYDDAVDVFIRDNYGDAPILDAEKEDALKDDIFAFNKKINPYDFSSTPSVSVQPSERSGFIIGVKDISAVLGNSVPKNIQEFLDALKKKYGLVDAGEEALGSNRFSDDEIISTDKIAGIVPMDILDEGYLNQNVSDFIELCRDLTKLDHIIVYPSDSEKPIFDSYEDWPGSEWVNLLGFGDFSCGGAPVRVTVGDDPDEITSRWYPTLGDFLDDANVDDAVVYDVDGNVIYKGPKDGVPEDILFMPFISYDAPAVLVINSTTTQAEAEELSSLDESKKKRKGKDGIAVHLNAGNPKKNMAFLNMSLGSDGFQGGMACCGGSATGGEGQGEGASIGENASENKAPTADCKMEEGKPIVKPLSARARKRAEFAKASAETRRAENERRANNTVLCPDMDFGEMQDFAFGYNVEIENTGVKGKYRLVGHPEDVDALKRELKSNGLLHETAGGDDREKALRKAFNLIKRKGCYAVIYAYTQGNGSVFLNPPLCKDSQEEVQKFVDAFKRGKQSARAVVDVLYKSQVDKIDTFDELIGKEAMAESRKFMGQGYRTINVVDNSKVDEMSGDELERMPDGTEKYCIRMLNSMIAYDWDRKETAKEFLDRIEGTHTYEYIKKYIDELGKDKVAELMQRQIDDVDRIVYAGTDSEGTGYNSIIWKDSKRESLKPRRLAGGEATGKANEDTEKLKDGRWANVGKDGKVDSGKFKTKKQADAQRKAMFANGYKKQGKSESYDDDVKLAGSKRLINRSILNYVNDYLGIKGMEAIVKYTNNDYPEMWNIVNDPKRWEEFTKWFNDNYKSRSLGEGFFHEDGMSIYEFPYDSTTEEDIKAMEGFGLIPLGKTGKLRGEELFAVAGYRDDLENYCKQWIDPGFDLENPSGYYTEDACNFIADFYDGYDRTKYFEIFGTRESKPIGSRGNKSVFEAKGTKKLNAEGIQYFGTKNQFNYDKVQLRIDHDAKTYEKGMFTHIAKREVVTGPEMKRIIAKLDDLGYKEVKGGKPVSEAKEQSNRASRKDLRDFLSFLLDCRNNDMAWVFEERDDNLRDALKYYGYVGDALESMLDSLKANDEQANAWLVDYEIDSADYDYDKGVSAINATLPEGEDDEARKKAFSLLDKAFGKKVKEGLEMGACDDDLVGKVRFLIEDENEAVDGYDCALKAFNVSSLDPKNREFALEKLQHIKEEELEHIRELNELMGILLNGNAEVLVVDAINPECPQGEVALESRSKESSNSGLSEASTKEQSNGKH